MQATFPEQRFPYEPRAVGSGVDQADPFTIWPRFRSPRLGAVSEAWRVARVLGATGSRRRTAELLARACSGECAW
ncbi:MAG: hypothetical protein JWN04_3585 [Myxococcaceae bacterium]|nr:hypothetical protein [Myxococcaceae bacterium]